MTDLETRICEIVADDLGLVGLGAADDLMCDHGVDEIGLMGVAMRLEDELGLEARSISEEALMRDSRISNCVELVNVAADRAGWASGGFWPIGDNGRLPGAR